MPDWKLLDEIQKDADVFIKLTHSFVAIYMCIFPSLFLFILLTFSQVRVVHIPQLWMGFYLREEEVPLAHGQCCRCPQLNEVTSEYRYFILWTDISCSLRSLECRRIYFSTWKFIDKSWQYCWIGHNWVRLHNSNSSRVSHHALNLKRAQLSSIIHFQWGISCQISFWTRGWWKSKLASNIWSHWFSEH